MSTSFLTKLFTDSLRALQGRCLCMRCPTLLPLARGRDICAAVLQTSLIYIRFLWGLGFFFCIWHS